MLTEELAKVNMTLPSCVGIHADIVAPYLVHLTNEEQKQRWLPRFCSGELLTAIGMTEPSGGSDLAALKTTAVRDGDDWILNGSKTFITNGGSADLVVVAARTAPEKKAKGISLFGVDTSAAGYSVGPGARQGRPGRVRHRRAGLRGRPGQQRRPDRRARHRLHLDDAVPAAGAARLGDHQPRPRRADPRGDRSRYAKERKAFGQPIGSFQNTQFLLADLVTRVEVTQAYVDQCVLAHTRGELTAVDAAKAKWWTSQVQNDVLDHCVQVYGGYGYMNEYRVARAWRDARVTKIWAGSNEIMKMLIGRDLGL